MTTVDATTTEGGVRGLTGTLAGLEGRSLLARGDVYAGAQAFLQRASRLAMADGREALHVTATRGHDRIRPIPPGLRIVDCTPGPTRTAEGVKAVGSPEDLTGVAMPVSRFIDAYGPRAFVTFDSLSTLLVYEDEPTVFRFLDVLSAQLRQTDGTGVFLIDGGCQPARAVNTLQHLFDGRLDVEIERARLRGMDGVDATWHPR